MKLVDVFVYDRQTETTTRVSEGFRAETRMATVANRLSAPMGAL